MPAKNIVITGVSRGLGRAMAMEFARLGHQVAGCARSENSLHDLQNLLGATHDFSVVDVTKDGDVEAWSKKVINFFGAPDLLINNAALINHNAPLWSVTDAEFSRVLDVNLKGVANVIRRFVSAMVARNAGVVVNFSSGWGRSTAAEVAPYCATKWGVEGLTQALAQELPAGMAAVPLNPGIIDTDMLRSCFGTAAAQYPTPEQWAAKAVPFLLKLGPKDNGTPVTVPGF
jgi:NAD(P)-dependent dehydrogenase (short-subunit alcohol dehydrogenase family)